MGVFKNMSRPVKLEDWHLEAIQHMVRTGSSLQGAAMELDIVLSIEDARLLLRRASFQRLLWQERHRYFNELATDPNFRKDTAVGKLISLAQKLEEQGEYDKASEVYFKVGKMMGWVGPESTVSVFGELTQRDLDAIRDKVAKDIKPRVN
jgi:hypothetical protein